MAWFRRKTQAPAPANGRKCVIDIRDVTKMYTMGEVEVHALRGAQLQIYEGEFVSIMGPSGSGKSTLMNILGCLDQPTTGSYFLDGVDVSRLNESDLAKIRNKKIGFVFQNFNLLKRTTALRQVELPLIYGGAGSRTKRAKAALEAVGLGARLDHLPSELSGGQQQRVAIARSLGLKPKVMLFDEVTSALDPELVGEVLRVLRELSHASDMAMLLVTHEIKFAADIADRVLMFDQGKIIEDGPPKQVIDDPQVQRTRQFLRAVNER